MILEVAETDAEVAVSVGEGWRADVVGSQLLEVWRRGLLLLLP